MMLWTVPGFLAAGFAAFLAVEREGDDGAVLRAEEERAMGHLLSIRASRLEEAGRTGGFAVAVGRRHGAGRRWTHQRWGPLGTHQGCIGWPSCARRWSVRHRDRSDARRGAVGRRMLGVASFGNRLPFIRPRGGHVGWGRPVALRPPLSRGLPLSVRINNLSWGLGMCKRRFAPLVWKNKPFIFAVAPA